MEQIDLLEDSIYELRVKVKQLHASIGRMFQTELITDDMIAEALDEETDITGYDSLKVIYNSWGGDPVDNTDAMSTFMFILNKIRSYQ
jgi:hypothetical protein